MYNDKRNKEQVKKALLNHPELHSQKDIYALGIDQGYANLGYSVIKYNIHRNSYKVIMFGTIKTNSKDNLEKRLYQIYLKLAEILDKYPIDLIGCEQLFSNGARGADGGKRRDKSVAIVRTNMSTGVIYLLSAQYNITINDFPPTTVKKQLTNSGKADKEAIIEVVTTLLTKQGEEIKTNHESDAIAIGLTTISKFLEEILNETKGD